MAVKMTGAEFKKFYSDNEFWPEDTWHEDAFMSVDGVEYPDGIDLDTLKDTSIVMLAGGFIRTPDGNGPALDTYFKRWRKKQNSSLFTVECDNTLLDAVKAAIKQAGGKVVS